MELALPADVRAALREHGFEPSAPLGAGAAGLRWSALGADGRRYAVVHAAGQLAPAMRARAERLARLSHPSLARCSAVLATAGGVVVLVEAEPGTDLGVLLEARGLLGPGEVVGLLAPIAEALAVLHAVGLVHGDVAPSNIVVTAGRSVLVDLFGAADDAECGTPGFAPPARVDGPSPAADVASLALVARALLGRGGDVAQHRPSSGTWAGEEPARGTAATALLALCDRVLTGADPGAAGLAEELRRACPPAPVEPADPAVLARLGLRRLSGAQDAGVSAAVTIRGGRAGPRAGRHRSAPSRGRRSWRSVARGSALALAAAVIVAVLIEGQGLGQPVEGQETAAQAAVRLTRERAAALVSGDDVALAAVTVPGSPAARADIVALAGSGTSSAGDRAADWDLEVEVEGTAACGASQRCVGVRTVTTRDGVSDAARRVVLVLVPKPWRVVEVRPAG